MANKEIKMEQEMNRLSNMLFNYESTSRTDYEKQDLRKVPSTAYVAKPAKPKVELKKEIVNPSYMYTMTRWKNCVAPFNLYIYPNPVHGCDPRVVQKPFEAVGDPDRENAQKTRPRLVMTPAVSLDDIEDPDTRAIIIHDTYISTLNAAQRASAAAAASHVNNIKAPFGNTYAPPKPLDLPKWKPKSVSPEWRMESTSWDKKQLRGHVDATATFWTHRPLRYRVEREN